ncbi:MAG: PrgI family protein [Actinomycetota bacterium]
MPANVDMPDRILAGLTLRQLLILAGDGVLLWLLYVVLGRHLPPQVFAAIALPLAGVGLALATSSHSGLGMDRLAVHAARFLVRPRRQVLAPEGLPSSISGAGLDAIRIPVRGVSEDGLVDLGRDGFAVICRASGVNLALRSDEEQEALIAGFGQFLNALEGPVQFIARSHRVDLSPILKAIEERAATISHSRLARAARAHASFLRDLSKKRDVLNRRVFVCFREPVASRDEAATRLNHRVDQATTLLRSIGARLTALSSDEAAPHVRLCCDPEGPEPARSDYSSRSITRAASR